MFKEDVKQKIIEIINDGIIHGEDNYGMPTNKTIESIADNIIEKVLQIQVSALEYSNLFLQAGYDSSEKDRKYWIGKYKAEEKRADIAEQGVRNAVKAQDCLSCTAFLNNMCNYMDKNGCERNSDECINNILKQAEKELAEESKDD